MAKDKESFILYRDLLHTVEKLSEEKAGALFKHVLRYVNDLDPKTDDFIVELAFEPIKQQLKRDLKSWESSKEHQSEKGKMGNLKRWNTDLYNDVVAGLKTLDQAVIIAEHRRASPPDNNDRGATNRVAGIANIAVTVPVIVPVPDTNNNIPSIEKIDWDALIKKFNLMFGKKAKIINDDVKKKYNARLKDGWLKDDIAIAMDSVLNDQFHIESGFKFVTLEYLARDSTLQKHATKDLSKPTTEKVMQPRHEDQLYKHVMAQVEKYKDQ
jgi:hypothetical protein